MPFIRLNLWAVAVLAWIGVIFFSSTSLAAEWCEKVFRFLSGILFGHIQGPSDGLLHLLADKGLHVTMFLVLGILLWQVFSKPRWRIPRILLAGAAVGSCSEFLQRFFPGRDPAISDVLINIGGTAVGIAIALGFVKLHTASPESPEPVSCGSTSDAASAPRM